MNNPTLKDISAEVGVSMALVSVVLNGKSGRIMASPETRKRILEAAARLGYEPDRNARGLRMARSFMIGVIVYDIKSSFVPEILAGIESYCLHTPYSVLLGSYRDGDELSERLEVFRKRRVDGLIIIGGSLGTGVEKLAGFDKIAKVFVGSDPNLPESCSVHVDGNIIGRLAADAFYSRGHRHFGYLSNGAGNQDGWRARLDELGVPKKNRVQVFCHNFLDEGFKATTHLLKQHPEITAVFADSDILGAAVLKAGTALGRRIPEDLAVIGVDDSPICRMVTPELSSIRQPRREQGTIAAATLLDMLDRKNVKKTVMSGELVVRQSLNRES